MIDTLYKEEILEHFHDPQNFGVLKDYTRKSKQLNPFCGDEIEVYVKLSDSAQARMTSKVENISFSGKGCAISIASASLLTEFVKGKTVQEVADLKDADMLELLQIEISETRKKCALLGLAVLKDCLDSETNSG